MHKALDAAIQETKDAKGYFVTITRLIHGDEGGLKHSIFTNNFRRDDIFPSLEEVAKLAEPQTKIPEVNVLVAKDSKSGKKSNAKKES